VSDYKVTVTYGYKVIERSSMGTPYAGMGMFGSQIAEREKFRVRRKFGHWRLEKWDWIYNHASPDYQDWNTVFWSFRKADVVAKAVALSLQGEQVDLGEK
jgi:hypothetical protein